MKKLTLFLVLVMAIQNCLKIIPSLAVEDKDAIEVKRVVETFSKDCSSRDIDSAMQNVSVNYSVTIDGNVKDYNTFKSDLQKRTNSIFEKYINFSTSEPQLNNLNIQDNKATVEVEISWKGFNLDTLKEDSGKEQRSAALTKENDSWKIIQWKQLEQSK